ncbi:ABC transporter ATP-binding protein [Corynebacterium hylobatis]|uniref:ABC transporter ATP-binding protein n=1 Tax=Corynebacterium hylobatis TaxID=1859290 RepID=A0A430I0V7_9CORY|nr:ABC transporter ATP-binding protein [Corynebacterium hylobatis]RSZ65438.1 ABC transporter ATP-binding protein [Corynebacterium hylobatis]
MSAAKLALRDVSVGYGPRQVIHDVTLDIPAGAVTTLIGPNGCGKSTLLKSMCGLLEHSGEILLDARPLHTYPRRERARLLTMLPQTPTAPEGLTVRQLIARGRHPHQSWLQRWSAADEQAVDEAVRAAGLEELVDRGVGTLSGGQRQRVWIAMVLAQDTATVLLDEPTTYLDLAHSLKVLELVTELQATAGRTIVMVLHDLNLAARFSDHLIIVGPDGRIAATGTPGQVLTEANLAKAFRLSALVSEDPVSGGPLVIPR